jgi:hypothetical protein
MRTCSSTLWSLLSLTVAGCAADIRTTSDAADSGTIDAARNAADTKDADAKDAGTPTKDGSPTSDAGTEACVTSCKSATPPNYGGFELYGYEACQACTACNGFGPCATNTSPPAGAACVGCLQDYMATKRLPNCESAPECTSFAACLNTCPR